MYALLMSIMNLGGMLSFQFGAMMMDYLGVTENNFTNLWKLILYCNLIVLLPLPLVLNMEVEKAQNKAENYQKEEQEQ